MQAYEFKSVPNYEHTLVWVNPTTPDLREEQRFDRYPESVVPEPGGTSLHFVTFPPSSVFADPSFDGEAARERKIPLHQTDTSTWLTKNEKADRVNTGSTSVGRQVRDLKRLTIRKQIPRFVLEEVETHE